MIGGNHGHVSILLCFSHMRVFRNALCAVQVFGWVLAQAAPPDGVLTVEASGFRHDGGNAVVKLHAPGDNVMGPGRWQESAPIVNGTATFHFNKLAVGRYAAVLFHDENGNGTLDHGLLGPAEPLAFSGGFSLGLFSGMPSFEKLQFEFQPPAQQLMLKLP
jgi:uncharacterized protein (DUF2141 family)